MAFHAHRHLAQAFRSLRNAPGFTISAVLLVAIGVGAVTTIFTLVDHILLRPLPYPEADRLVTVERGSHSGPLFREMQTLPAVQRWAAGYHGEVNLTGAGAPMLLEEANISDGFLRLLGATPVRGRLFESDDFKTTQTVVLSEGVWRRIWGADPDIIGRTIQVDGEASLVLGVVDAAFVPPEALVGAEVDLWRPIDWTDPGFDSHERWMLEVVGQLRSGATAEEADLEMIALMGRMAPVHDNYVTDDGSPRSVPVALLADVTVRGVRSGLGALMGAVGLLLLVACANIAHLFLARGLSRNREMAIRRTLGADTPVLVGQLMMESLVVGVLGGALGLVLASAGLRAFIDLNPEAIPRQVSVGLDLRILLFAAFLSVLTALIFGLLPTLRAVHRDVDQELRGASRTATVGRRVQLFRNGLIVAEVALSLVLVAGAGLFLRSFVAVQTQDPGFELESVWTIPLTPTEAETPDEYRLSMDAVRQSLANVPGVRFATYGLTLPLEMTGGGRCCWRNTVTSLDEASEQSPWMHPVSEGFFETFSIPILYGRNWSLADAKVDPVPVVVTEELAVQMFGGGPAAVGQHINTSESRLQIVGVAGNTRHYGLDADHGPALYLPMERLPFQIPIAHMAVKMEPGSGTGRAGDLREAVWRAEPNLPVPTVRSMDDWLAIGTAGRRFDSALFGSFGVIALLLAAGGLYGTLLYMAGQRRRELAIRRALGASQATIERRMLRSGLLVAFVGVLVGLAGAWATARFLESRLWGIEHTDPIALFGAAAVLMIVASFASWLPARVAGRTDPLEALKAE